MFAWFSNMKVGTKLMTVIIVLTLVVAGMVGGLGYFNLSQLSNVILQITDQRVPSVKNATAVERYALRTIMDEKRYLLSVYDVSVDQAAIERGAMDNIAEIIAALDKVDTVAKQYNDQDLLAKSAEVRTVTLEYKDLYTQGVAKLQANVLQEQTMADKGALVVQQAQDYFNAKLNATGELDRQSLSIVVDIWNTALQTRLAANKYMRQKDPAEYALLEANMATLDELYNELSLVATTADDRNRISTAQIATQEYYQAAKDWKANDDELTKILGQMNTIGLKVQDNAFKAEEAGWTATEGMKATANQTSSQALTLTLIAAAAAILLGLVVAFFFARSLTNPLRLVAMAAEGIAEGDLDQKFTINSRDELGQMASTFERMINYLQNMASVAQKMAQNDLTEDVTPKSERDLLGNAFAQMIASLRIAISQVAENAGNVNAASGQLAAAAGQAGQATSQIATTVQQVAKGTTQQTEAVTRTAGSVEQMKRAIDGVAKGAQEQAAAVGKAATVTAQISAAIEQVAGNAEAVSKDSASAAEAARSGSKTVADTIQGMNNIKAKVGVSAQKVQEMGQRSDQIGAIVETIDDIASQTNLLALNAAIEAARAGEHGKGFAVVADEVRKLAEKSAGATKEIAGLIKGIQQTVNEAVRAMDEGAQEVERGAVRANEAGQALTDILKAAEAVNRQAEAARQAAHKMGTLSSELVNATDAVSAVVEENTAATEEMAAGSSEVTQAIENIASVSEQNSAAVEEVSASAEEMSAQVEEVTASAQSLNDLAQNLQQVVTQFRLPASSQQAYRPEPAGAAPVKRLPVQAGGRPVKVNGNGRHVDLPTAR